MRDDGVLATAAGEARYHDNRWSMFDGSGEFDPRSGSGITEPEHEALDTLVHDIAEDCSTEITRVSGRVSVVTVWTDSSKTTRIRETTITRTAGRVSQVVTVQYDVAGAVITGQTLTETITRTGGRVSSVQAVES